MFEELKYAFIFCIGVWVVVRLCKGRSTTIWQGNTSHGANKALFKHITESDERVVRHYSENDEFGKGQTVVTKDKTEGENFYTTGEL